MIHAYTFSDYALAVVAVAIGLIPLSVSVWALLDAAKRPAFAWALAERDRVHWIAAIVFTALIPVAGVVLALYYLLRVRPHVHAAEEGHF